MLNLNTAYTNWCYCFHYLYMIHN